VNAKKKPDIIIVFIVNIILFFVCLFKEMAVLLNIKLLLVQLTTVNIVNRELLIVKVRTDKHYYLAYIK
jgi:hypothetical protein